MPARKYATDDERLEARRLRDRAAYYRRKPILQARQATWRAANRERARAATAAWRLENPARTRENNDRQRQVATERLRARRETMLLEQGGVCAICGTADPGSKSWHVDHDHACCPVAPRWSCGQCDRGVLCNRCNCRLVAAAESPLLPKAFAYLEKHNAR